MSDLIDRQAAIKWVKTECNPYGSPTLDSESGKKVIEHLKRMPPAHDPVKHGEWLPHPTETDWDVCSVCGIGTRRRFHFNDGVYGGYDVEESFAYCPNCGAKMDGGKK